MKKGVLFLCRISIQVEIKEDNAILLVLRCSTMFRLCVKLKVQQLPKIYNMEVKNIKLFTYRRIFRRDLIQSSCTR